MLTDQLVPVPSIFFIGESGAPLEIVGNKLSASDLASKIDSIVLKVNPSVNNPSASLISAEQVAHSSSNIPETDRAGSNPIQSASSSETPTTSESNNRLVDNVVPTIPDISQEVSFFSNI